MKHMCTKCLRHGAQQFGERPFPRLRARRAKVVVDGLHNRATGWRPSDGLPSARLARSESDGTVDYPSPGHNDHHSHHGFGGHHGGGDFGGGGHHG